MIPHPAALGALFAREGKSGAEVSFSYRERTEDSSRELRLQTVRSLSSLHPCCGWCSLRCSWCNRTPS